ncbi:unnamed protein product [Ilex paraguariensis]|uniref:Agenet domain-containing protein n=1 Tax=Ilex paraguariensis TaxID=185542 RepID=A0ABC8USE5_9AQUA
MESYVLRQNQEPLQSIPCPSRIPEYQFLSLGFHLLSYLSLSLSKNICWTFTEPSATMVFRRGDRVEVASKEEGFNGSYYAATVISELLKKEYIVQYKTLLKDDLSGPLREIVSVDEFRPAPPEIPATGLGLYDKVDAFDNDGWWVGKITGKIGNEFFVYLRLPEMRLFTHWKT